MDARTRPGKGRARAGRASGRGRASQQASPFVLCCVSMELGRASPQAEGSLHRSPAAASRDGHAAGGSTSRRARGWWQHLATGRAVHAVGHAPWRAECRTHCILRCSLGTDKAGAVVFCCCTSKAAAVVLLLLLAL